MSMLDVLSDSSKWCKGVFYDGNKCCLRGAIAKNFGVAEGSKEEISYHPKLEASIRKLFPVWNNYHTIGYHGFSNLVPTFNNHPLTTFDMVRAVVEDADLDCLNVLNDEIESHDITYHEEVESYALVEV
jgi:hypothetical protein